ncbi:MAG: sigma-70 family RNA polymerase sigma factor [Clostridia bacterium]|nr:sigma-70 family RNA polymerase sigma factor [Clostridia bacterium]
MDDKHIIAMFFARDEAAIARVQEKYARYCQYIAEQILGSREDAEECVNDMYRRAWETIPPQRPPILSSYLGMLTRHIALDRAKERRAQKRGGGMVELLLGELQECISDAEAQDEQSELLREALDIFLATLPQRTRVVFVRRYWYADTAAAIAKAYGMSESNVNTLLFRTRKKLRRHLREFGIDA